MRNAMAQAIAAALAAIAASSAEPAQAVERWVPAIPPEIGVLQVGRAGWVPYRCSDGPVYNFYDDALYGDPPAVHLGYVYRQHWRYTAWRVVPRTYVCAER